MNGIVSLIKPPGISSHDAVAKVRKILNTKKVGHAGTLDPGAAGVLVLGINKATKLLEYIQGEKKVYRAEIQLGKVSDSGDLFGRILNTCRVKELSFSQWQNVLDQFLGPQEQIPPMTSALKKDGVRLYELARKNQVIKREARKIHIYQIQLINIINNRIIFDVTCSSGTYIRVLCQDIAKLAGSCGLMSFLLRKSIGNFTLDQASFLTKDLEIKPMLSAVDFMPKIKLDENELLDIKHGRFLNIKNEFKEGTNLALLNERYILVAIAQYSKELVRPKKVFM